MVLRIDPIHVHTFHELSVKVGKAPVAWMVGVAIPHSSHNPSFSLHSYKCYWLSVWVSYTYDLHPAYSSFTKLNMEQTIFFQISFLQMSITHHLNLLNTRLTSSLKYLFKTENWTDWECSHLNLSTRFLMYCLILYFLKRFIIRYIALIFLALLLALPPRHILKTGYLSISMTPLR